MISQLKKINDEIEKNDQNLKIYERNDFKRIQNLQIISQNLLRLEEMVYNFIKI